MLEIIYLLYNTGVYELSVERGAGLFMQRAGTVFIIILIIAICSFPGCKKNKEKNTVDMNTIQTDGSHDSRYIFRKEIEKEEKRGEKAREPEF